MGVDTIQIMAVQLAVHYNKPALLQHSSATGSVAGLLNIEAHTANLYLAVTLCTLHVRICAFKA